MTTHCYHNTSSGHEVNMTMHGSEGPVLITFHGGGIVNGSRRDEYVPKPITSLWPGILIEADYRLLVPSSGLDILADMKALFSYLLTLPIPHHQLFLAGFSGGGYPLRLAAVLAAEEKERTDPRFTVQGWVSFFGMGGDFLLDHWFTPRDTVTRQPLWPDGEPSKAKAWSNILEEWSGADTEYSDLPYTEGLDGHIPSRGRVWESLHGLACFNDALTGDRGLSERLAALPYTERPATIPEPYRAIYPQLYFESGSDTLALTLSPCLLIHGDRDDVVPYEESLRTSSVLKASGASVELITIRGGDHNLSVDGAESPDALKAYQYAVTWMLGLAPAI